MILVDNLAKRYGDVIALRVVPGAGRTGPETQSVAHSGILPVTHHLALQAEPRSDETKFTPAVGRLVEVHEVHVDGGQRYITVEPAPAAIPSAASETVHTLVPRSYPASFTCFVTVSK